MRKVILIGLALFLIFPIQSLAQFQPPPGNIFGTAYFYQWRDEYRAHFSIPPLYEWDSFKVYFETIEAVPYQKTYPQAQVFKGIYWLTCNGTYQFQFLQNNVPVYWTDHIVTTAIQNPGCNSYPDVGGNDDLQSTYLPNPGNDGYTIFWNGIPGANGYEIWMDGQLIGTVPGGQSGYEFPIPEPGGGISIVAKDSQGNYIGHSDINVPDDLGQGGGGGPGGGCGVCDKISEALSCPEWNTYMGELTRAIKNALPTLPEWRQIADQFVDAFDEYFGPVPAAPTKNQIENEIRPDLPALDTHVPGSDMVPILPSEYDTPFVFDVTDAPEIPVVDESEPFDIYEPDQYIDADDPGVFVIPGDPRNHSGGIKTPDAVDTGDNTPAPTGSPGSPPPVDPPIPEPTPGDPTIPPADMPEPTLTAPDIALPTK